MFIKKNVIYILFIFFSSEIISDNIKKVLYASWDKPDVEILYKLPKEINEHTKVVFIIHGNSRDVERFLKINQIILKILYLHFLHILQVNMTYRLHHTQSLDFQQGHNSLTGIYY